MVKGLKTMPCEERLEKMGLFHMEQEMVKRWHNYSRGMFLYPWELHRYQ